MIEHHPGVENEQVEGGRFTLLFEQIAMTLVREMPVMATARIIGIIDQRLLRIVEH